MSADGPVTALPPLAASLALRAEQLTHAFGERAVLRGVSLEVGRGEVVAVTGPSGSGKSTLLHLLGGLDTPLSGEVWWGGTRADVLGTQARAAARAAQLGFVFQHHYLLDDLSLAENLRVPLLLAAQGSGGRRGRSTSWGKRSRRETAPAGRGAEPSTEPGTEPSAEQRIQDLLNAVGLGERAGESPAVLSGGERQRAAIVRALVARPRALLADEPTGSLDQANARAATDLMFSLARSQGTGVLLVTHDEALAARADRRLHLVDGVLSA